MAPIDDKPRRTRSSRNCYSWMPRFERCLYHQLSGGRVCQMTSTIQWTSHQGGRSNNRNGVAVASMTASCWLPAKGKRLRCRMLKSWSTQPLGGAQGQATKEWKSHYHIIPEHADAWINFGWTLSCPLGSHRTRYRLRQLPADRCTKRKNTDWSTESPSIQIINKNMRQQKDDQQKDNSRPRFLADFYEHGEDLTFFHWYSSGYVSSSPVRAPACSGDGRYRVWDSCRLYSGRLRSTTITRQ